MRKGMGIKRLLRWAGLAMLPIGLWLLRDQSDVRWWGSADVAAVHSQRARRGSGDGANPKAEQLTRLAPASRRSPVNEWGSNDTPEAAAEGERPPGVLETGEPVVAADAEREALSAGLAQDIEAVELLDQTDLLTKEETAPSPGEALEGPLSGAEMAALEEHNQLTVELVEHWRQGVEGALEPMSPEPLDSEGAEPETPAVGAEVVAALAEQARMEAQALEEWVQVLELSSVGSADEASGRDGELHDPVVLIQEKRAALAEQARIEVEETERMLEFLGTLPDEEQKVR